MNNYSNLSQIMHKQFLENKEITNAATSRINKKSLNFDLNNSNHIFITGLARAGTTALLQAFDSTNKFGSLRYKYMPFILIPKIAGFYAKYFNSKDNSQIERMHADGLKINNNSPECLDEPYWMNTIYKNNSDNQALLPHDVCQDIMRGYAYLLNRYLLIENKDRLIIKNNNNHLRITSLASQLPNSLFIVVFRYPFAHSSSLLSLHKRFKEIQDGNNFVLEYMNMIGHWEFGKGKKPFIYDEKQLDCLKKSDDMKIEYWLKQWIYTYEWILKKLSQKQKNIKLVCYEDLCNNKEYKNNFFKKVNSGIIPKSFKFKLGKSNSENIESLLCKKEINYSLDLYSKLREISLSQFSVN